MEHEPTEISLHELEAQTAANSCQPKDEGTDEVVVEDAGLNQEGRAPALGQADSPTQGVKFVGYDVRQALRGEYRRLEE
ncbi:hypothetical protein HYW32_01730 [Candidatus Berkelbacteria bacterium]|nr:hypothetical protein [Candidatus Berkelbacteria bacterium]